MQVDHATQSGRRRRAWVTGQYSGGVTVYRHAATSAYFLAKIHSAGPSYNGYSADKVLSDINGDMQGNQWLGKGQSYFIIDLEMISKVKHFYVKNTLNHYYADRWTTSFSINAANETSGTWMQVLTDNLPKSIDLQIFSVPVFAARYIKFQITGYGGHAGGLSFFQVHGPVAMEKNYWKYDSTLTPNDAENRAGFGQAVAADQNRILVGAPWKSSRRGAAYIFFSNGTHWNQEATLAAPDGQVNDYFGNKVALQGEHAFVGAQNHAASRALRRSGAVYVYRFFSSGWSIDSKLLPTVKRSYDYFGASLSVSGDYLLVGATGKDVTNAGLTVRDAGQVYVFRYSLAARHAVPPAAAPVCDWQCYLDRYADLRQAYGASNVNDAENHWKEW
jgi:hypothetical protein